MGFKKNCQFSPAFRRIQGNNFVKLALVAIAQISVRFLRGVISGCKTAHAVRNDINARPDDMLIIKFI